jgi:hypothetical protein
VRVLVLFVVLLIPQLGRAGVDVVVAGNARPVSTAINTSATTWLSKHNFDVTKSLPSGSVVALSNCLSLPDMKCARALVEARNLTSSVLALVSQASGAAARRTIELSAYWIDKGHDVISLQRTCDACTDERMAQALDAMMTDLAKLVPAMQGRVKISSTPPGVLARVDDDVLGMTPVEKELTAGPHELVLMRDSTVLANRHVDVAPAKTVEVDVPVAPAPAPPVAPPPVPVEHRSQAIPIAIVVTGVAAIATGALLYKYGGPTGDNYMYRDLRTPGIGVAAGGCAISIVGVILLARGGIVTASPTIALGHKEVFAGWSRSF